MTEAHNSQTQRRQPQRVGHPRRRQAPRPLTQRALQGMQPPRRVTPGVGTRPATPVAPYPWATFADSDAPPLKIYALGGLEEIGRNCTVFECGDDVVVIDVGLMFPEEGMPGIDYIIPNISSLIPKAKNIRGLIVTHGHMDHIGGIPLTITRLGNPVIYTAPLTAGIIRKRQEEYGNAKLLRIQNVQSDTKVALGRNFVFEPFHVNHNISDAFGAALHTPHGTILYTGDFKFDFSPVNDEPADLTHIAMFGARGVLALMSDSTNAESPGHQISEKKVGEELDRIIGSVKGRLIVGTFSSMLTRLQQIISLAEKYGKKIMIEGRSMNANVELAHSLGYMHVKPGTIIEESEFHRLPDDKIVVVCTGSQGEKNAVLMRLANNEHRFLQVKPGDSILFSSSVIPGNERTVQSLKDTLVRQGAKVFHYANLDVHAGGHAKQEDLKLMMRLTKPKHLIPIHGNRFLLEAHAQLGEDVGIPRERIFVAENGQVMEFKSGSGKLTADKVVTDYVMVDGLGVGDVSQVVLRDRVMLAEDGIFVVIATIDKKSGAVVGSPDIISRGFVYMRENKELIERARVRIKKILKDTDPRSPAFEDHLKNKIRNDVGQFLFTATKRRPMILPVIIEV
jgi:ribonuclease J